MTQYKTKDGVKIEVGGLESALESYLDSLKKYGLVGSVKQLMQLKRIYSDFFNSVKAITMSERERLPEYRAWTALRNRCANPNNPSYKNYGARGISVCERWDSFEDFIADMGMRPSPRHSIDRINNNGNYEPSNCRWATIEVQSRNRNIAKMNMQIAQEIRCVYNTFDHSLHKLAKEYNVGFQTISKVINNKLYKDQNYKRTRFPTHSPFGEEYYQRKGQKFQRGDNL